MTNLRSVAFATAALAAGVCFSGGASASTVCLNATHGSDNFGPDSSCATSAELEVKLNDGTDTKTGSGDIKTTTLALNFSSSDFLDLASGNATITPAAKGHATSFGNLDMSISPGFKFTDLLFNVELLDTHTGTDTEDLTVTAWFGATKERSFTYDPLSGTGLPNDAVIDFTVADAAGLTAVDLSSTTGIKEAKSFDVSGAGAVPEPSTWALMVVGFAGLGYAAFRRAKSARRDFSAA